VYRLSSVINRLRKKGLNIITEQMHKYDGTTYAEYFMRKEQS